MYISVVDSWSTVENSCSDGLHSFANQPKTENVRSSSYPTYVVENFCCEIENFAFTSEYAE